MHSKTPQGHEQRVYIGKDKAPRQRRLEFLATKLARISKEVRADRVDSLQVTKRDGPLYFRWRPVAKIEVPNAHEARTKGEKGVTQQNSINAIDITDKWKHPADFDAELAGEWQHGQPRIEGFFLLLYLRLCFLFFHSQASDHNRTTYGGRRSPLVASWMPPDASKAL